MIRCSRMAFDFDAAVKPSVHEPLDRLAATSEPKAPTWAFSPRYGVDLPLRPNWQAEAAVEGQWSGSLWALPPPLPLHSAARTPRVCAHSCSTGPSAAPPSR